MIYSMNEANALLDSITDEAGLRNLISQLDVFADGNVTVLYSGYVDGVHTGEIANGMASDPNIRVIDKTEAARFLQEPSGSGLAK